MAINKRNLKTKAEALQEVERSGGELLAVPVGEKYAVIPQMPKFYRTKNGRVIRANMRMHINNHISSMKLEPLDEMPDAKPKEPTKEDDVLSAEVVEALDKLAEEGFDLASEKLKDISDVAGIKITGAMRDQYLAIPR